MKRLFCSLDWVGPDRVLDVAGRLKGEVGGIKLGAEYILINSIDRFEAFHALGLPIMLDLKLNDLPKAASNTIRRAAAVRPFAITVHTSGGAAMMRAAAAAAHAAAQAGGFPRPKLLAVTVLTSMDEPELHATGIAGSLRDQILRTATLAHSCGLDGVWTSARELPALRSAFGPDFLLVVPAIRPVWSASDDQKQIMTPGDAMRGGADYLVVGRPITQASDPAAAARRIAEEMTAATARSAEPAAGAQ
jgi:orotidine-5'-phosphate decarboxylase